MRQIIADFAETRSRQALAGIATNFYSTEKHHIFICL